MLPYSHRDTENHYTTEQREDSEMKKTLAEIQATMKELSEYTRMAEELTAQIDALKDEIKAFMTDENLTELLGENGSKVYWKSQLQNRFDTAAFRKSEWGSLYEEFTKQSEVRPFKFYA